MILGYLPCYVGANITPFDQLFTESICIDKPEKVSLVDAILLWGGEDIAPIYYGQDHHPLTQNKHGASKRDEHEFLSMCAARDSGVPIIGVCRGAQFLCAFAGGALVQHMTGHHKDHDVMVVLPEEDEDGRNHRVYQSSSDHHQMMDLRRLPAEDAEVLAWSASLSNTYQNDEGIIPNWEFINEPECVYFPKVRGLAIQGHPEWQHKDEPYVQWCLERISSLLLTKETV
jgi:GMP synthase-like glutamine amidotransferase